MIEPLQALQVMDDARDEQDAATRLDHHLADPRCLGGRVRAPGIGRPCWHAQVFYSVKGWNPDTMPLPDGIRKVTIPPVFRKPLGILEVVECQ